MKESNLSFKNIFKRETKLATYIILCVTVVVISSSYALFFQVNQNSKNQEVVAGDLVFTYENGETITGTGNEICFEPMTYEESTLFVSECGYRFSARNTGSLKASYTIKLVAKEENEIELSKLKVVLKKQNMETLEVVSGYPKLVSELENGVLIEEEVDSNSNIVYSVQIFFEENLYEDTDINKKVMFEIVGSGLVHEEQEIHTPTAVEYIQNLAKTDTTNLMYDGTIDNNLRYIGSNPNNYVKIDNSMWRIIGAMNNVSDETGKKESKLKLIGYQRNDSDFQKDYVSDFYSMRAYLTEEDLNNYYSNLENSFNETIKNFLSKSVWHNGFLDSNIVNQISFSQIASTLYQMELSSNSTYTGNVALASLSDFVFAAKNTLPDTCSLDLTSDYRNDDCSFKNAYFYDIEYGNSFYYYSLSPFNENKDEWYFMQYGEIKKMEDEAEADGREALLTPVIYLKSGIKISGGNGTFENPYILNL